VKHEKNRNRKSLHVLLLQPVRRSARVVSGHTRVQLQTKQCIWWHRQTDWL